jgi:hypothetical protein
LGSIERDPGLAAGRPIADPGAPGDSKLDPDPTVDREELEMHPVERPHLPTGRVPLARLALEAVMIAFGVLLALSLESWNEHRKERALAREALANIRVELISDRERIQAQLPKQEEMAQDLREFREDLKAGKRPPEPHLAASDHRASRKHDRGRRSVVQFNAEHLLRLCRD